MTKQQHLQTKEKQAVTWVLVADGASAKVYAHKRIAKVIPLAGNATHHHAMESQAQELVPVAGMAWEAESPSQYEVGRNATGMVFESAGGARHMASPHIDARTEVKQHFAVAIAERLDDLRARGQFDRLVLVAPPKMLGEIRKQLGKSVLGSVVAEVPKELTHFDNQELLEHLQDVVILSA